MKKKQQTSPGKLKANLKRKRNARKNLKKKKAKIKQRTKRQKAAISRRDERNKQARASKQ